LRFAKAGASVLVSDIDDLGGAETARLIVQAGGQAIYCHADVRDETDVLNLISTCESTFGAVSVLVNNASIAEPTAEGIDGWMTSIDTDLLGTIRMTKAAVDAMSRDGAGSIVNIASISALWHGRTTAGGFPGYDIAKAGMIRMTTQLAEFTEPHGIRVNCLAPGWIAAGGALAYWSSLTPSERSEHSVPATLLEPEDVADVVMRIADDESLSGRVGVGWAEDTPRLIRWGDRGYRDHDPF